MAITAAAKGTSRCTVPVAVIDGTDMRAAGVAEIDADEVRLWLGVSGTPRAVLVILAAQADAGGSTR